MLTVPYLVSLAVTTVRYTAITLLQYHVDSDQDSEELKIYFISEPKTHLLRHQIIIIIGFGNTPYTLSPVHPLHPAYPSVIAYPTPVTPVYHI